MYKSIYKALNLFAKSYYYDNNKYIKKAYFNVFDPLLGKLYKFAYKYEETDELKKALIDCKEILIKNLSIANPVLLKTIDCILDEHNNYNENPYLDKWEKASRSLDKDLRDKKKNKIKRKAKEFREFQFNFLLHDIVNENIKMKKALGLPNIRLSQKVTLDKQFFSQLKSMFRTTLVFLIIILVALAIVFTICKLS